MWETISHNFLQVLTLLENVCCSTMNEITIILTFEKNKCGSTIRRIFLRKSSAILFIFCFGLFYNCISVIFHNKFVETVFKRGILLSCNFEKIIIAESSVFIFSKLFV